MSEPITVLLVDDHALVRQGVRAFLETQGDISVVAEAGSGEEAVKLADAVRKAASGEAVLHPRVAARVVRELHGARRAEPNVFHDLSDRELEVLKLIAE